MPHLTVLFNEFGGGPPPSTDDLGNFASTGAVRAQSGEPSSSVRHRNFLPFADWTVRFALHAVSLDVRHDAQLPVGSVDDLNPLSRVQKNERFWPPRVYVEQ